MRLFFRIACCGACFLSADRLKGLTMKDCPEIVVIEDDGYIRESVCDILEDEGHSVLAFCNGKDAIEGLRECKRPCLILLDLMMPVMNGWEFLEQRKNLGDTIVATPVFIVSAVADPAKVKQTGAIGYVKKPIDIDVLLSVVRAHCGRVDRPARNVV